MAIVISQKKKKKSFRIHKTAEIEGSLVNHYPLTNTFSLYECIRQHSYNLFGTSTGTATTNNLFFYFTTA